MADCAGYQSMTTLCAVFTLTAGGRQSTQIRYGSEATINDIDRVFKVLDGQKHQPRALELALNAAMKDGNLYEDECFKVRGFKNGNGHIEFKRADLLEKAHAR